jgi:quercetin dioxygenase-like cupin family protein
VWWLLNEEEAGSKRGVLAISEIPPGKRHVLHRHPNCEQITYVLSGSGLHLTTGEPVRQETDEAVYVAPGEWHGFENDTSKNATLIMIYSGVGSREEAGYELFEASANSLREPPQSRVKKVSLKDLTGDGDLRNGGSLQLGEFWLITSDTVGSKSVALGISNFEVGGLRRFHRHPAADEFCVLLEGSGRHLMADGEIVMGPKEATFVRAGEWHGFRKDPGVGLKTLFCYLGVGDPVAAGYDEAPSSAPEGSWEALGVPNTPRTIQHETY